MTMEDLTRDLIEVMADGNTVEFTWSGTDYDGVRGALGVGNTLVDGGFENDYEIQLSTTLKKLNQNDDLVDRFSPAAGPQLGDQLTHGGTNYRVKRITTGPLGAVRTYQCEEV